AGFSSAPRARTTLSDGDDAASRRRAHPECLAGRRPNAVVCSDRPVSPGRPWSLARLFNGRGPTTVPPTWVDAPPAAGRAPAWGGRNDRRVGRTTLIDPSRPKPDK